MAGRAHPWKILLTQGDNSQINWLVDTNPLPAANSPEDR